MILCFVNALFRVFIPKAWNQKLDDSLASWVSGGVHQIMLFIAEVLVVNVWC
jgi:hypothetical protein